MLRLTRRYSFSASHRLHSEHFSEEENSRLFGKCNNPYGHGHNYVLEVAWRGYPDGVSGLLLPRAELDRFVEQNILSQLDHANLNTDIPSLKGMVPTTENLVLLIDQRLRQAWTHAFPGRGVEIDRVRVEETARNHFEIKPT